MSMFDANAFDLALTEAAIAAQVYGTQSNEYKEARAKAMAIAGSGKDGFINLCAFALADGVTSDELANAISGH